MVGATQAGPAVGDIKTAAPTSEFVLWLVAKYS